MLLYQEDAELLFPARVIPLLRNLRGDEFRQLVDRVAAHPSEAHIEVLGFGLMMIQLASCLSCTADSYRAMNGCTSCAMKTVRGFRGTDQELIAKWQSACEEVRHWQQQQSQSASKA